MKFVDEATIRVEAGKGGDGCLSFRREKFIPRGGPDGGDGGDGGSVYLKVNEGLNTLVDFRHARLYRAQNGRPGMGKERAGKSAEDLVIEVPLGTLVYDDDTDELLGDLNQNHMQLLVAQGGFHGLGNTRFKSSTNRAPRQTTKGSAGDSRNLRLELQVLADVGLLGLPNAGKSTLIRSVSAARPKVADYPFTTLYPQLGVVQVDNHNSFVIADIPGLIEGASDGAGLGIQFLRHLNRTHLLLHLVDFGGSETVDKIAEQIKTIETEIARYDSGLLNKDRWMVLNKIDLLVEEAAIERQQILLDLIDWSGPVYSISAVTGQGCQELTYAIQHWKEGRERVEQTDE